MKSRWRCVVSSQRQALKVVKGTCLSLMSTSYSYGSLLSSKTFGLLPSVDLARDESALPKEGPALLQLNVKGIFMGAESSTHSALHVLRASMPVRH